MFPSTHALAILKSQKRSEINLWSNNDYTNVCRKKKESLLQMNNIETIINFPANTDTLHYGMLVLHTWVRIF